jgi:magnesium-dependent phosphatase 1
MFAKFFALFLFIQFIIITVINSIQLQTKKISIMKLPKLIAFDLDGTIWSPDMYELWGGGGAPFSYAKNGRDLVDRRGTNVIILGISDVVLHELKNNENFSEIKVAWVSCTDEPDWADECLRKFKTSGGSSFKSCADSSQIFQSNKQRHFEYLKKEFPNIEYNEMLFFDNEYRNIVNVSKLEVKCVHCANGITQSAWNEGLSLFEKSAV